MYGGRLRVRDDGPSTVTCVVDIHAVDGASRGPSWSGERLSGRWAALTGVRLAIPQVNRVEALAAGVAGCGAHSGVERAPWKAVAGTLGDLPRHILVPNHVACGNSVIREQLSDEMDERLYLSG